MSNCEGFMGSAIPAIRALGVVYDETDQIALPPGRQSRAWMARMKATDVLCGQDRFEGSVRALGGHYYITGFGC
jgi:hypothetical protein